MHWIWKVVPLQEKKKKTCSHINFLDLTLRKWFENKLFPLRLTFPLSRVAMRWNFSKGNEGWARQVAIVYEHDYKARHKSRKTNSRQCREQAANSIIVIDQIIIGEMYYKVSPWHGREKDVHLEGWFSKIVSRMAGKSDVAIGIVRLFKRSRVC